MIEPLLLAATHLATLAGDRVLSNASGFFFEARGRLFVVSSRHVFRDEDSAHLPDRIVIEVHTDASDVARATGFSLPLYDDGGAPLWRQAADAAGAIDVALIEIDRSALPPSASWRAFTPQHLLGRFDQVEVGTSLLIVGFPLGFHDTLHHLPVVRQAVIASSFGLRFQGQGYFLTDGRTHRGTSGAPVVMRIGAADATHGDLPWMLLGVHSARLDVGGRDVAIDEALGLNCAWYADCLLALTE